MLRFQPADAVSLGAEVTGINRLCQDVGHASLDNPTARVPGEVGEALEEPLRLGLASEAAVSIALKGLPDDVVERRIGEQHSPAPSDFLVSVADGWIVDPIAGFHTRLHLLSHLAPVLFALELARGGDDDFVGPALV